MSRRSLILFILAGFLWGIPYLFIRVAVDPETGFSPAIVVFSRVFIGALILVPIAIYDKSFFVAIKGWKYIAVYALFEMAIPWILIGTAEQSISSGLAGLLVATVPIFSTVITALHGDKTVWEPRRMFGIAVGFLGVFLLVGIESFTGSSDSNFNDAWRFVRIRIRRYLHYSQDAWSFRYSDQRDRHGYDCAFLFPSLIHSVARSPSKSERHLLSSCAGSFLHWYRFCCFLCSSSRNRSGARLARYLYEYRVCCRTRSFNSERTANDRNHRWFAASFDWFVPCQSQSKRLN